MIRDLLGRRIKKHMSLQMQGYLEKYYIWNGNIYQIVRARKQYKLGGVYIELEVLNGYKLSNMFMKYSSFLEKKLYNTYGKALNIINNEI